MKSVAFRTRCEDQTNEANTTNDHEPNSKRLTLLVIEYQGEAGTISLVFGALPTAPARNESDRTQENQSISNATEAPTNTSNLNLPSTSYSTEQGTAPEASTSGIHQNTLKRSLEEPQIKIKKTKKDMVVKTPNERYAVTDQYVDIVEGDDRILLVDPILVERQLLLNGPRIPDILDDQQTTPTFDEPSTSAAGYSAPTNLDDDNSNYSSFLTEEEKFDSFYEKLTE